MNKSSPLMISRPKALLENHPAANNAAERQRRRRVERLNIKRNEFIKFAYTIHYGFFTFILLFLWITGCFVKGDYSSSPILHFLRITPADTDCSVGIEVWFMVYMLFCPIAWMLSIYVQRKSRTGLIIHSFMLETWYRHYEIWTNQDRKINWAVMGIEIANLVWAIIMAILNSTLDHKQYVGGAITECMRDFGMNAVFFCYIFMAMGFA